MFSVNGSLEELYKGINDTKCWYWHLNKRLFAWVEYFQNLYKSIAYCNMDSLFYVLHCLPVCSVIFLYRDFIFKCITY